MAINESILKRKLFFLLFAKGSKGNFLFYFILRSKGAKFIFIFIYLYFWRKSVFSIVGKRQSHHVSNLSECPPPIPNRTSAPLFLGLDFGDFVAYFIPSPEYIYIYINGPGACPKATEHGKLKRMDFGLVICASKLTLLYFEKIFSKTVFQCFLGFGTANYFLLIYLGFCFSSISNTIVYSIK